MKRLYWLLLFVGFVSFGQTTIFSENMGTPTANTLIATYVGGTAPATFQNVSSLTFLGGGTTDVRTSTPSTTYVGASGGGNVFVTTNTLNSFQISGINTLGYNSLTLSFGHFKSTTAGNNELVVEVSSDGTTYTPLTYTRTTGAGTAIWTLVTPTGTIPSTANLRIRFRQTSTTTQFRIDDVVLKGVVSSDCNPSITTQPTNQSIVEGNSTTFTINATNVNTYQWQVSTDGTNYTNIVNGGIYNGVNTSTLSILNVSFAMSGYKYRCQLSPNLPCTNTLINQNFNTNDFTFVNNITSTNNNWRYGSAAGNPSNSIYISNDNGITNSYTTTSTPNVNFAYRDVAIPVGTTTSFFSFDWRCNGERTVGTDYDYLRVWLTPTSFTPIEGTQITSGAGRIQIGGNFNLQNTWTTFSNTSLNISSFAGTTMRIIYEWRNDSSSGNQFPAAIDNVILNIPNNIVPVTVVSNVATLTVTSLGPKCGYLTDLFMSQVTDASSGGLSYIEIYNGTGAPVNLGDYSLKTASNGGAYSASLTLNNVILNNNSTYVVSLGSNVAGGNDCTSIVGGDGSKANQIGPSTGGINFTVGGNDHFGLFKGSTLIDSFGAFGSATWADVLNVSVKGVDFKRKNNVTLPNTTYSNSDWVITDWSDNGTGVTSPIPTGTNCSQDDYSDIGIYVFTPPNSTTWDGNTWSNGVPTLTKLAIINGNYNTTTNGDIDACSLIVNLGFLLEITDSKYVKIENDLTVFGTLNVLNNGSLIQINNNGVNTGNITYNRNVTSLKGYDYIYWSSPVSQQSINNLYTTPSMGFKYYWNTLLPNSNGSGGNISQGNWSVASGNMIPGMGYIIRASSSFGWTGNLTAIFTDKPNNGIISIPIYRGTYNGVDYTGANGATITSLSDNWNLIGNPYPSAISAESFLTTNTNINGAVHIWTHTNPVNSTVNPFYASFQYNYNNDYIVYNKVGSSGGANSFSGSINTGQGFFVSMVNGPADSTQSVVFNNSMRVVNDNNFYRSVMVKSRIWIDLLDSNNNPNRILVGYVNGATQNIDRMYDAITSPSDKIYSIIDSKPFIIQGRPLPFKNNDEVKLGVNITTSGIYKIAIAEVDGVFDNRDIYLEDKLLNITYDLKSNPYSFTSNVGVFNDRFVLKYKTNNGNNIKVNNNIKKVYVYDMMGVKVFEGNDEAYQNMVLVKNHIYIVKTEMEDGVVITKKVLGL